MATENPILPAPEEQVSKAAEDVQKATSEVTPEVPDSETAATAEPETPAAAQGEPAASAAEAPVSEAPAEETVAETVAEAPAAGEAAAEAPADGKGAPAEVPAAEVPAAEVVAEASAAETAAEAAPAEETARAKRARIKPAAEAVVTETEEEAAASDVQVDFADEEAALAAQDAGLELEGETAEEAEAEQMAGSAADTEDKFTGRGKEELVALFTRMLEEQPVQSIRRDVEALKIAFYRIRRAEVEAARRKFIEEGGAEEDFAPAVDGVEVQFKELFKEYRRRRDEFIANLEAEKEKNLQVKLGIIEELKELVNSDETLNHTFTKFRELQQRWKETGIVPLQNVKDLWETYNLHVENFYSFIKINISINKKHTIIRAIILSCETFCISRCKGASSFGIAQYAMPQWVSLKNKIFKFVVNQFGRTIVMRFYLVANYFHLLINFALWINTVKNNIRKQINCQRKMFF